MKNRKFLIIFANILITFIFVLMIEFFIYNFVFLGGKEKFKFPDYTIEGCIDSAQNYRNFFHEEYKNKPIWLMGCSYAYGYLLSKEQSLGEKLSKKTKRPVYNWAWCGIGPAEALIRLYTNKNDEFLPKIPPEYVIYVYSYNQVSRYPRNYNILYSLKEFKVLDEKNSIFDKLYMFRVIKQGLFNKTIDASNIKKQQFMKKIFFEMKKQINRIYPETKFIILIYNDTKKDFNDGHLQVDGFEYEIMNSKEYWKEFQDNGFNVIWTKDLIGREMNKIGDRIKNDKATTPHPTSEAWDLIVPELVKNLSL